MFWKMFQQVSKNFCTKVFFDKKNIFSNKIQKGCSNKARFSESICFKMKIEISSRLKFRIFCPISTFQKTSDSSIIFKI